MAISKLDESNRMPVKNLLRWVAFALRPVSGHHIRKSKIIPTLTHLQLSLDEVTSTIAINVDNEDIPFFDEDLKLLDTESFIESCSSLVSTYCVSDETSGTQNVYVKLAHFTVREFLAV